MNTPAARAPRLRPGRRRAMAVAFAVAALVAVVVVVAATGGAEVGLWLTPALIVGGAVAAALIRY